MRLLLPPVVSFLIAMVLSGCGDDPAGKRIERQAHYSIDVLIQPPEGRIESEGILRIPGNTIKSDTLELFLHSQLEVESFSADRSCDISVGSKESDIRFLPEARKITVTPEGGAPRTGSLTIKFDYGGRVTRWPGWSANVIGEDWTEIGLYFPWFPFSFDLGPFTYRLNVTCGPEYQLASIGEVRKTETGWSVDCPDPTNDIVICLAKDLRVRESEIENSRLRIYHFSFADSTLEALSSDIAVIIRSFNRWFAAIGRDVTIVESRREKGGGYGRIGGIFLGGFDGGTYMTGRESFNRYLAHELSHQWWHRAPSTSWEDWLNESFAEYSALSLIREVYGTESFNARLEKKKNEIEGTSPIWGFDRNGDPDGQKILYSKGPVLLFRLEERIGRERFLRLCSDIYKRDIAFTEDFLELLEDSEGVQARIWFEEMLKTL